MIIAGFANLRPLQILGGENPRHSAVFLRLSEG